MNRARPQRSLAKGLSSAARRGFTMIELMMAMVVSGIVLMGIFAFSSIQQSTAELHYRDVRMQQALEGAMWSIGRDVRMAGLGVTRMCTELRVWDQAKNRLANPGAVNSPSLAATDPITSEPYWVLRDGLQAHWRSSTANGAGVNSTSVNGGALSSAFPASAADSFDVLLGERNYTVGSGTLVLNALPPAASSATAVLDVRFETGSVLNSGNPQHLKWVQQLMPPGGFIVVARATSGVNEPFRPESRGQCVLLQITGEIQPGASGNLWKIPIANNSGFNANLAALMGAGGAMTPTDATGSTVGGNDWNPSVAGGDAAIGSLIVPVGKIRWSRYEIDYSVSNRPYLVRTDFITWRTGDPVSTVSQVYPSCPAGPCQMPQLRLPVNAGDLSMSRVAIAPMIEDMQIAVGCDGYRTDSTPVTSNFVAAPDVGFNEPVDGSTGRPNLIVDELAPANRNADEWLGNSAAENTVPDCVYYGTGEKRKADWIASGIGYENLVGPGFRMSPQMMRVTLVAKPESESPAGYSEMNLGTAVLFPLEDRAQMPSNLPNREYRTFTQTFAPRNLRWRDPAM